MLSLVDPGKAATSGVGTTSHKIGVSLCWKPWVHHWLLYDFYKRGVKGWKQGGHATRKTGNLVIIFPDRENTGNLIKVQGKHREFGQGRAVNNFKV